MIAPGQLRAYYGRDRIIILYSVIAVDIKNDCVLCWRTLCKKRFTHPTYPPDGLCRYTVEIAKRSVLISSHNTRNSRC